MTVQIERTGASSALLTWDTINWSWVEAHVRRLQMRIAKATREGKRGKVKSLQWVLTHSYYAKLLAIRRVVRNKGSKTPGIDGVIWDSDRKKMLAVKSLKRRGYCQPRCLLIPLSAELIDPLNAHKPTMPL